MKATNLRQYAIDDNILDMVYGGGFFAPNFVGRNVYDDRYKIPTKKVYWAALDGGERTYFAKVLLIKVFEQDTGRFLFWKTSKTLAVIMDDQGNFKTIPVADLYYVK